MKFCLYIFLFAIIFRPAFPFLDYVVNYHYIATELCENKNVPKLGCNGKCHLKKELAKAYKNDIPASGEKKSETGEAMFLFFTNFPIFIFDRKLKSIQKVNSIYKNLYSHLDSVFLFRPPVIKL
ncbi:hypothetical protein [Flavobacterium bizetiae]|uniref:hypothetical protein n=1 Tax=Flavobacterium bizetiae TaxID=2704140 RepID=UPI003757758D